MSLDTIRSLFSARHRARRNAARDAIDGHLSSDVDARLLASERSPETDEAVAMAQLVGLLDQLPGEAWDQVVPAAEIPSAATGWAGRRASKPGFRAGLLTASAVAALAVAFFAGSLTHPTSSGSRAPTAAPRAHVVLLPVAGADSRGLAVAYMTGHDGMRLHVADLPKLGPGSYYELWLMTSTTKLVSITSFRVDAHGRAELTLSLPADPSRYRYLDISLQRVGSGTAISSESVLRGALT